VSAGAWDRESGDRVKGCGGTKTAEYWIVPSGATFDSTGTEPVDESKVPNVPDHPKPAAKKKAAMKMN